MDRSVRGHPLSIKSISRKLHTYRIPSMVGRPYESFKRMFHFDLVMVTGMQWGKE